MMIMQILIESIEWIKDVATEWPIPTYDMVDPLNMHPAGGGMCYTGYGHQHQTLPDMASVEYHHAFYHSGGGTQQHQRAASGYAHPHGAMPAAVQDNYDPYPDSLDFQIGRLIISQTLIKVRGKTLLVSTTNR